MAEADNLGGQPEPAFMRELARSQQLDGLLRQVDSLPADEAVLARLLELNGAGAGAGELAVALSLDAALAGWLVSLAARKRPDLPLQRLSVAFEVLGQAGLRKALLEARPADAGGRGVELRALSRHSLAVACAAEMAARRLPDLDPQLAFLCGLLHDLGKYALANCLPKSYQRVLAEAQDRRGQLAQLERELIGLDHGTAGRHLARHWHLPQAVQEAIWLHHQPAGALGTAGERPRLIGVVQLADALARQRQIGFSGNFSFPQSPGELAQAVGLSPADAQAVGDELAARMPPMALDYPARTPAAPAPYPAAIASAAVELARANEGLSAQVGQLRRQATVLAELAEFVARVSPTLEVHQLCREVAGAFSRLTGAEDAACPVGAFAILGDGSVAIAVGAGDRGLDLSVPARPAPAAPQAPLPAQRLQDLLLDGPVEALSLEAYLALPLLVGGVWVGGVLLPREGGAGLWPVPPDLEPLVGVAAALLASAVARLCADQTAEQLAEALQQLARTSQALSQARTLATVSELAAGAAHEMNNPLAVISGRAQLLATRAEDPQQKEAAELIARKAQEVSDLVTDLMAFARPAEAKPRRLPPAELLESARARFLTEVEQKARRVSVDIRIQPNCPDMWADPEQMAGVLVELLRNAATAAGGAVAVALQAQGHADRRAVGLRVSDNGPGMDELTLAQALTPFFSRRPAGRGRGMGLAHAHRTVQVNGGRLWLESRPEGGTTVFIDLPAAGASAS